MGILVGLGLIYCGYGVFINFKFVHVSTPTDISDEDEDYLLMQTKSSTISLSDNETNYISYVVNLVPTFYINETINLNDVYIVYHELVDGVWEESQVPVTMAMLYGFNTATIGTRTMTISYCGATYDVLYHVIERSTEKITSDSFEKGIYYAEDTTEETEHFMINIEAGSYLVSDYKIIIEKIYDIEEKVTGLKFPTNKKIEFNIYGGMTSYGGGAAGFVGISHGHLFTSPQSAFIHELVHALQLSQPSGYSPSSTIIEGFATYVQYLTAKEIYKNYPELCKYVCSPEAILSAEMSWGEGLYQYDFEEKVLVLERDEIIANSQYEAGGRFFAYLHHKFGDFSGWATDPRFNTKNLEAWKSFFKEYYKTESVFSDFYPYEQSFKDRYYSYCGVDYWLYTDYYHSQYKPHYFSYDNLSLSNKFNYYLNLAYIKEGRAYRSILYKDLYINLESLNLQMNNYGIQLSDIKMSIKHGARAGIDGLKVELYNAKGKLITEVSDTSEPFSVDGVSFVKLVGTGYANIDLIYQESEYVHAGFVERAITFFKDNILIFVGVAIGVIIVGSFILVLDSKKRKAQKLQGQDQSLDMEREDIDNINYEEMPQHHVDLNGNIFYIDENGNPFYIDENGNPFYIDENGNPFYILENGEIEYLDKENLHK